MIWRNNGTGYSTGDIILLRQTASNTVEYLNATTNNVITPNSNDLGSISTVIANASTNLNTSLLSLESTQVALSAKLPSSLGIKTSAGSLSIAPASDATFTQKSNAFRSSAALTRANNTNPYAANDIENLIAGGLTSETIAVLNEAIADVIAGIPNPITTLYQAPYQDYGLAPIMLSDVE